MRVIGLLMVLLLIGLGSYVIGYLAFFENYGNHWGATSTEVNAIYPGESIITEPRILATHAIDIAAPREIVWRYIAQIGQERAGFYSYQWLENLIGCQINNVYTICQEWQHPYVGQIIYLAPGAGLPLRVVEPNHAFVMGLDSREIPEAADSAEYMSAVWGIYLQDNPDGSTRLISRMRGDYVGGFSFALMGHFMTWADFFMDRRMFGTIRELAEREIGNHSISLWEEETLWFWSLVTGMLMIIVGFLSRLKMWLRVVLAFLESLLLLSVFYFMHPIWLAGLLLLAALTWLAMWQHKVGNP